MNRKEHGAGEHTLRCATGTPSISQESSTMWLARKVAVAAWSCSVAKPSKLDSSALSKAKNSDLPEGMVALRVTVPKGAARNQTSPVCPSVTSNAACPAAMPGWTNPAELVSGNCINHCHHAPAQTG